LITIDLFIINVGASIGIAQLNKLKKDLKLRASVRKTYIEAFKNLEGIIIHFKNYTELNSNYIFPIILENSNFKRRDAIREKLAKNGIQTSVHYPAVHKFSIYKEFYKKLPVTDYIVDNLTNLTMYSKLSTPAVEYIAETLNNAINE
jgi:dTDP-4-amino-4,6-dideoxygalactose transaminase